MDYRKKLNFPAFTIVELPPSLKFRRASLIPNKNIKQGFTIVELLVVIVVIGILAAITIISYTGISNKATVSSLQSDLSSAKKQLALYYIDHSSFPTGLDGSKCPTGSSPSPDNRYCLKTSSNNTFTYSPVSLTSPQSFTLVATNTASSTKYIISPLCEIKPPQSTNQVLSVVSRITLV